MFTAVKMELHPELVFYVRGQDFFVCQMGSQRCFKLNTDYFSELMSYKTPKLRMDGSVSATLAEAGLILPEAEAFILRRKAESWQGDTLSYFSHLSTRNKDSLIPIKSSQSLSQTFLNFCEQKEVPLEQNLFAPDALRVPLPPLCKADLASLLFVDCMQKRKTSRNFTKDQVPLALLAELLSTTFNYHNDDEVWDDEDGVKVLGGRQVYPTATGLQMYKPYVLALRVDGLASGIYGYATGEHELVLVQEGFDDAQLLHLVCDQFWCQGVAFVIVLVGDLKRVWSKDRKPRGYNTAWLEAGLIVQNMLLHLSGRNLQTMITGTFRDQALKAALRLEQGGERYLPSIAVFAGRGSRKAVPEEFRNFL